MGRTFQIAGYTPQDISRSQTAQKLWQALDSPLVGPRKFDSVERAKFEFTAQGYDEASKIYRDEGMLFVRGSKDSFTAMFMGVPGGWAVWNFWWDVKAMTNKKKERWLDWVFRLCRDLPVYYGFGCSVEEFDAKHTSVESVPGGHSTGSVGAAAKDFYNFLPGLYWLTVFGPELVDHFGSKLNLLPNVKSVSLDSSQCAIVLDEPVIPDDMNRRLGVEAELSGLLGEQYFFDRNRTDIEFEAVPELASALRNLKDNTEG